MKQVLIRQGRVHVTDMPAPSCGDGEVLVRAAYSLISSGTEMATVRDSAPRPSVGRWSNRVKKAGEVLKMVAARGLRETGAAVKARLEGPSSVSGYSLSGTVLAVGSQVTDLVPGQRVACAGASSAHHAEIVAVPRNLVAAVPESLSHEHAAFVTLGTIALHGVRQADPRLGEIGLVIGLGLLGQLSVAMLRAAGCRVVGSDLDAARVERARALGLDAAVAGDEAELTRTVNDLSSGRGADFVIVTAAAASSEPLRQAIRLVRSRGRVVVVGAVGMEIDRGELFAKEAELRISRSYGPGRYDRAYEEDGADYPYDFVRWTENRNMVEFLRLAADGRVPLNRLADESFDVEDAARAYARLSGSADRPLGVLLRYPAATADDAAALPPLERRIDVVPSSRTDRGIGVALVGPGSFAREMHLPNLARLAPSAELRAVVGRSANSGRETARRQAADYVTTELATALDDAAIDLVLICTRHDRHAELAIAALRAGKAVFLEKPAATRLDDLDRLESVLRESDRPFTVGFNRRFAPTVIGLRERLAERRGPLIVDYRVNAGRLPRDHWALGPEGGGRLVGEACHMIDLLRSLVGRPWVQRSLQVLEPPASRDDLPLGDNFCLVSRYADGSVTSLTYTSLGHAAAGKERLECHWDGRTATIDDFRELRLAGSSDPAIALEAPDKGHAELLRRFVEHVAGRAPEPIPSGEILDVSRLVLELDREARGLDAQDRDS